jgi:hypothetical protein
MERKYPLTQVLFEGHNYELILGKEKKVTPFSLHTLHTAEWGTDVQIHPLFTLHKIKGSLEERAPKEGADILYYDAFAPDAQPELWEAPVFEKQNDTGPAPKMIRAKKFIWTNPTD